MSTADIWRQFHSRLKVYIKTKVSDTEIANDILQDVFVKIHLHSGEIGKISNLQGWIFRITQNQIIDHYRKQKKFQELKDYSEETEPDNKTHQELAKCLLPFVDQLQPKYKNALIHTDLAGGSQKDYAAHNNISYTSAKTHVQRARKQLKDLFLICCTIDTDKYGNVLDYYDNPCKC